MPALDGLHALVTGSSDGIGQAVARALAEDGATVLVSGRDAARCDAVAGEIRALGGKAVAAAVDLAGEAATVRSFAGDAVDLLDGHVDVLVNNAAVYPVTATANLSDADLNATLAVNVRAPHLLVAELAPAMARRGHGSIVNVSSWMSRAGTPAGALYSSSKAALEQLTRSWAAEFGPSGVRVNTVAPGATVTPRNAAYGDAMSVLTRQTVPGRPARREEIAAAVRWLASPEASYVHASRIDLDGGLLSTRL
jgi:3-oxoacyl-[acyl-carrier protein] reductase